MHVLIGPYDFQISPRTRASRHPNSKSVYALRIAPSEFQIPPRRLCWVGKIVKWLYADYLELPLGVVFGYIIANIYL